MMTRAVRLAAMFCTLSVVAGCSRSGQDRTEGENRAAPSASASTARPATTSADASAPSTLAGQAGAAAPGKAATYTGTYALVPGKYYIADTKDFSSVKQVKDDPSKFVGEGTVTLVVDASGKLTGTIETGPASPGLVDGSQVGEELRGRVRRKDLDDNGLTGLVVATLTGDSASGTFSLAESNASIVREGKVTLKRK